MVMKIYRRIISKFVDNFNTSNIYNRYNNQNIENDNKNNCNNSENNFTIPHAIKRKSNIYEDETDKAKEEYQEKFKKNYNDKNFKKFIKLY